MQSKSKHYYFSKIKTYIPKWAVDWNNRHPAESLDILSFWITFVVPDSIYALMKTWYNLPSGESWPPDGWKGCVDRWVWWHTNPNTHTHTTVNEVMGISILWESALLSPLLTLRNRAVINFGGGSTGASARPRGTLWLSHTQLPNYSPKYDRWGQHRLIPCNQLMRQIPVTRPWAGQRWLTRQWEL